MASALGVQAGRFDLLWQPGANLKLEFVFKDEGTPVDLTGASVVCEVRDAPGETLLVSLTSSIAVGTVDGLLSLNAPPTLTDDLLQTAVWDLKVVYPDASADRILTGRVILDPQVSV